MKNINRKILTILVLLFAVLAGFSVGVFVATNKATDVIWKLTDNVITNSKDVHFSIKNKKTQSFDTLKISVFKPPQGYMLFGAEILKNNLVLINIKNIEQDSPYQTHGDIKIINLRTNQTNSIPFLLSNRKCIEFVQENNTINFCLSNKVYENPN